MTMLDLEILVMDYLDAEKIKDVEKLDFIAEQLHSAIENAISDYAADMGIDDYMSNY